MRKCSKMWENREVGVCADSNLIWKGYWVRIHAARRKKTLIERLLKLHSSSFRSWQARGPTPEGRLNQHVSPLPHACVAARAARRKGSAGRQGT